MVFDDANGPFIEQWLLVFFFVVAVRVPTGGELDHFFFLFLIGEFPNPVIANIFDGRVGFALGESIQHSIKLVLWIIEFDADLIVAEIEAAQSEDGRKIIERLAENNVADKPKEKKRMKFRTLASISAAVLSIGFVAQVAINNVSNIDVDTSQITTTRKSFQNEAASTPSGVNLVVTGINGKSWIGLTNANGEQVFNGQISSGQVATFTDPQLIKAVIGNAGAVKLNLNGSDLGVAGAEGEVVRLDFDANGQL